MKCPECSRDITPPVDQRGVDPIGYFMGRPISTMEREELLVVVQKILALQRFYSRVQQDDML